MNFFSSEAFLGAVAASFFPRRDCRVTLAEVDGRVFRVLRLGRARVVHDVRFLDYLEPMPMSGGGEPVPRARFLRRACHGVVPVERYEPEPGILAAPLVRWERFPSFDDFVAHVEERSKSVFKTTARKARKLERELGPLRFERGIVDEKVLLRLFAWKSDQYRRTSLPDLFAAPTTRALFRNLVRAGAIELSGLYAGDRLVAAHAGPRCDGRFYHWVPAYDPDPDLGKYSAGNVLNHELMRQSHAARDHTFDMLLGDEPYKWRYATHVAKVGPLGDAPVAERAWSNLREAVAAPVRRVPALEAALRSAKRALREREILR
jgi:CelD/BcsL family acetyltransferase involved in cellulose biosynthesis